VAGHAEQRQAGRLRCLLHHLPVRVVEEEALFAAGDGQQTERRGAAVERRRP
jgi:hypothetical protein